MENFYDVFMTHFLEKNYWKRGSTNRTLPIPVIWNISNKYYMAWLHDSVGCIWNPCYKDYIFAMAAWIIGGYLAGYLQFPNLLLAYSMSGVTERNALKWSENKTFALQRIYPFAQECGWMLVG